MEDGPGVSINRTGGLSSPTCCVMTFCPSFSGACFSRSNLEPPANALSGTFPATAGTLIFAQSPHPRNRQFGWACLSAPYYVKRSDSEFPRLQTVGFVASSEKNTTPKGATAMLRPLILLLALSSWPVAQNISRAQGDDTKIIALENLWNQMQINHDADAMGSMLDSDFVLTDYDGSVMSKAQFLASIRDKSNQLTVEVSDDMKLHRHGNTVVVTGATREKGTEKGKPYAHQGRFTDTWIKKDGQWLCVASQLSLISSK